MKQTKTINQCGLITAATLAIAALVPGMANATLITLSGNVDNLQKSEGAPIAVGDTLSAMFDVNLKADNSFDRQDVSNFSLTVGPASYTKPSGSDFNQFRGQLSGDGSTLTDLLVGTGFTTVPGLETAVALSFEKGKILSFLPPVAPSFSITGTGTNTSTFGAYKASGSFDATVGSMQTAVPEPSSVGLLGLGVLLMGWVGLRRKKQPSQAA